MNSDVLSLSDKDLQKLEDAVQKEKENRKKKAKEKLPEPLYCEHPQVECVGFYLIVPVTHLERKQFDISDRNWEYRTVVQPDIRDDLKKYDKNLECSTMPEDMEDVRFKDKIEWAVALEIVGHCYRQPNYGLNWEIQPADISKKLKSFKSKFKEFLKKYPGSKIVFGGVGEAVE